MYRGAQFGDGGLVTDGIYNSGIVPSETIDLRDVNDLGLLGGGELGSNWQIGSFVYGVEEERPLSAGTGVKLSSRTLET